MLLYILLFGRFDSHLCSPYLTLPYILINGFPLFDETIIIQMRYGLVSLWVELYTIISFFLLVENFGITIAIECIYFPISASYYNKIYLVHKFFLHTLRKLMLFCCLHSTQNYIIYIIRFQGIGIPKALFKTDIQNRYSTGVLNK